MILQNDKTIINVICNGNSVPKGKIPIIFLHGFTGCANDWLFLFDKLNPKFFPIAIDLPGHGKSIVPNNLDYFSPQYYSQIVNLVLSEFNIEKAVFVGYSMGGRTALSFAAENSSKILALILESATAGIRNKKERSARINSDLLLADKIVSDGIDAFVDYWLNLPFFISLKKLDVQIYSSLVEAKKNNSPIGLSNSLKGFSTGIMPSLWNNLATLTFPTLLIAGSFDSKYVKINNGMNQNLPNSTLKIMENCGHNTHLEKQEEFVIFVNDFLNKLN